jgi:hypothetical protein
MIKSQQGTVQIKYFLTADLEKSNSTTFKEAACIFRYENWAK